MSKNIQIDEDAIKDGSSLKEPAPDQPKTGILLADWLDLWSA